MAFTWPLTPPVRISQFFADRPGAIQPRGHTGMDFAVPIGTPVLAAGAGTVLWADWATKLSANNAWYVAPAYAGICVIINHGNGLLSLYAHLNSTPLLPGTQIRQGQELGKSGTTGLSTGPHLHFEIIGWPLVPNNGFYGRLNPANYINTYFNASPTVALKANQRLVGPSTVNHRSEPRTNAPVIRVIQPNTVETFTHWVVGENVDVGHFSSGLWYKDADGYSWCGGFTEQKTDGLAEINPPLKINQRRTGADTVKHRARSTTDSEILRVIPANSIEEFVGFVHGEMVNGNDLWYQDAQGFAWSGGFTEQKTDGLVDITPAAPQTSPGKKFKVGGTTLNQRKLPYTNSEVIRIVAANSEELFTEFSHGDSIESNNVWLKDTEGYIWSGGFESQDTSGLNFVAAPANPNPVPPPVIIPPVPEQPPVVVVPDPEPEKPPVVVTPIPVETLKGVDISNHQKGISPQTLNADFIIVKASEGVGWEDPQFKTLVAKARATGKLIGFYHFARPLATPDNTSTAEAESFYKIVKTYLQPGDIVALDWEAENQQNTIWAEDWLNQIAELTNSNPLIYMSLSVSNAHNWTTVQSRYKLWLAQYPFAAPKNFSDPGQHGNAKGWDTVMWQYTSEGQLPTWSGNLDLNIFYGVEEDWKSLGVKEKIIVPDPEPELPPVVKTEKEILMAILEKAIDEYLRNK